jgi:hypothetical protein
MMPYAAPQVKAQLAVTAGQHVQDSGKLPAGQQLKQAMH